MQLVRSADADLFREKRKVLLADLFKEKRKVLLFIALTHCVFQLFLNSNLYIDSDVSVYSIYAACSFG
jgi:hypothetical protein